jgi:hypothetical protein
MLSSTMKTRIRRHNIDLRFVHIFRSERRALVLSQTTSQGSRFRAMHRMLALKILLALVALSCASEPGRLNAEASSEEVPVEEVRSRFG